MKLLLSFIICWRFGFCKRCLKLWNLEIETETSQVLFSMFLCNFCLESVSTNMTFTIIYIVIHIERTLKAIQCHKCRNFWRRNENSKCDCKKALDFFSLFLIVDHYNLNIFKKSKTYIKVPFAMSKRLPTHFLEKARHLLTLRKIVTCKAPD